MGRPQKHHTYTQADIELIKEEAAQGQGRKSIFSKYVTQRKNGKKKWTLGGIKSVARSLKKAAEKPAKEKKARKRTARTAGMVSKVQEHAAKHPRSLGGGSERDMVKKFKLLKGTLHRILKVDLSTKCLRKVKKSKLTQKHRGKRVAFCEEIAQKIKSGDIPLESIFFTDEFLFRSGHSVANKHNNYVRVEGKAKKKDLPPELIIESHDNSNVRIMVARGISKMGCVPPIFVPRGAKINSEVYKCMFEQQYYPAMSALSYAAGRDGKFYFQQDNASSHKTAEVLKSIKKHSKTAFPEWPACSPDLSPLDFFYWNELKSLIEKQGLAPKNEASVRAAVCVAAAAVQQQTIDASIDHFAKRCEKRIEAGGGRFEHLM